MPPFEQNNNTPAQSPHIGWRARRLALSIFPHRFASGPEIQRCAPTWDELSALFETWRDDERACGAADTEEIKSQAPLFSPAEWPPGAPKRTGALVVAVHFAVLDFDHLAPDSPAFVGALERLQSDGIASIVYTTWSHGRNGEESYRVILPLSRPVERERWPEFWHRLAARFAGCDPACKDLGRGYYLPSAPAERWVERAIYVTDGANALDVDSILREPLPVGVEVPRAPSATRHVAEISAAEREQAAMEVLAPACERIRATPTGTIYPTMNAEAFKIGTRVPHYFARDYAIARLLEAVTARNPDPSKRELRARQIEKAIDDGSTHPYYPAPKFALSDTGNAERLVHEHGERFRHVVTWRKWIAWDGSRWALDGAEAIVQRAAKATLRDLFNAAGTLEDDDASKSLAGFALSSQSKTRRDAMVSLAAHEEGIGVSHDMLDRDPWALNVANGTIDLRSGALRAHDPTALITKLAPVAYDPGAACPTWDRFLFEIMNGDPDLVAYLQRAVGYSLTGTVREHVLFFAHGSGANGKGTFVETLLAMLGDYAAPGASDLLLSKRGEPHPVGVAMLHGLRFVACSEVEQNRSWDEALVKSLTGGDTVTARRMHENFWKFTPSHKFWISGNHEPVVKGTDDGIWRRMRKLPFAASFKGREDRLLSEKLRGELSGILAWAVRGCLAWQRDGLGEASAVRVATEAYRSDQDTFAQFIRERCTIEPGCRITRSELRRSYETWCGENGETPLRVREFVSRVRALGVTEGQSRRPGVSYPESGWNGLGHKGAAPGTDAAMN